MGGVATIALCALLSAAGCGRPAQVGPDRGAIKAVDALYTAVGLRDPDLVGQCLARLQALRDEEKIPDGAFRSLESIAAEAKRGGWEPAQVRLIAFLEGQAR